MLTEEVLETRSMAKDDPSNLSSNSNSKKMAGKISGKTTEKNKHGETADENKYDIKSDTEESEDMETSSHSYGGSGSSNSNNSIISNNTNSIISNNTNSIYTNSNSNTNSNHINSKPNRSLLATICRSYSTYADLMETRKAPKTIAFQDFYLRSMSRPSVPELLRHDNIPGARTQFFEGPIQQAGPIGCRDPKKVRPLIEQASAYSAMVKSEIADYCEINNFPASSSACRLCVELSKDQDGSRFLQKKLEGVRENFCAVKKNSEFTNDFEELELYEKEWMWFLSCVAADLDELACDQFGNYVVQKFLEEKITHEFLYQRLLKGQVLRMSLHMYGCRVVQKTVENLHSPFLVFQELLLSIDQMICDQNGNHVVQKAIEKASDAAFVRKEQLRNEVNGILLCAPPRQIFLFEMVEAILPSIVRFSNDKYGCRVVQKFLETVKVVKAFVPEAAQLEHRLVEAVIRATGELALDQYGNYVLQHIIQENNECSRKIMAFIKENCFGFSTHKFASNVVETVIKVGDASTRQEMLKIFLDVGQDAKTKVKKSQKPDIVYMSKDKFGNYVVQQLYKALDSEGKKKITNTLSKFSDELKSSHFSKHIIYKLINKL